MVEVARLVVLTGILALPAAASAADAAKTTPAAAAAPSEEKPRGPAEDLVLEAAFGYGAGPFTAIAGESPRVAHGPAMHFALGWAWTIKSNQSLGLEAALDGTEIR